MSSNEADRPIKRRRIQESNAENHTNGSSRRPKSPFHQYTQFLLTSDAPIIFSSYIKVALHTMGILIILIICFQLIQSCNLEIQDRHEAAIKDFEEKIRICHYNYITHDCGPDMKGVYWQTFCNQWDKCRNEQPQYIGRAKIATQVFGELMNGFVEPLSLKAMLSICLLVFGFFIISSLLVVL